MRDPERIDVIIDALKKVWKKHPDLRFYQLIENITGMDPDALGKSQFMVEDDVFLRRLSIFEKWMDEMNDG